MQRHKRLTIATRSIEECVQEGEHALSNGWQPQDDEVLMRVFREIRAYAVEAEDVERDLEVIRRVATVGRHLLWDERTVARERDFQRVRAQYSAVYRQKRNGSRTVEVQRSR
jgi:hypothetical protein